MKLANFFYSNFRSEPAKAPNDRIFRMERRTPSANNTYFNHLSTIFKTNSEKRTANDIYFDSLSTLQHGEEMFPPIYYTAISNLEHRCLSLGGCPNYKYTGYGVKHAPVFECEVQIQVLGLTAKGRGTTKKSAKHAAANSMMELLHKKIVNQKTNQVKVEN